MKFDNIPSQIVKKLGNILKTNNFNQIAVESRLQYKFGSWFTALAPTFLFPLFVLELSPKKPLDALLLLFYCCNPVGVEHIRAILGSKLFEDVCKSGLLKTSMNMVKTTIQIIPFYDLVIATERPKKDRKGTQYLSFDRQTVMTLFPDTYDLAKRVKSKKAESILDLFCGNGVQTLSLAKNAKKIVGVDINRQALEFAKLNSLLNSIDNVRFEYCDVNKPMDHLGQFDMIVANPPFCPAIKQETLFCDGGQNGDYFIELLLNKRLVEIVNDGGRAYIISPLAIKNGETVKNKIASFHPCNLNYKMTIVDLGGNNIALNSLYDFLVYFIASRNINNLAKYVYELKEYFNHFKKLNINHMAYNFFELTEIYRQGG